MVKPPALGAKIRALRHKSSLTQSNLARKLGISASYLNLIEHDRRPLTANVLFQLGKIFGLNLDEFMSQDDSHLISDLEEILGDPLFEGPGIAQSDLKELVASSPVVAKAMILLYQKYRSSRETIEGLVNRLEDPDKTARDFGEIRLPGEEVNDLIQSHMNYFPSLESAAERLWKKAKVEPNNILASLVAHLQEQYKIRVEVRRLSEIGKVVRHYDPQQRILYLNEVLPPRSRNFQLAHQIALLGLQDELKELTENPLLSSDEARTLAHIVLSNYFAGALLMPYERFLKAVQSERYDVEVLGHRFRTSYEQVCHRLTTLRRPGSTGVPFHMVRLDIAGNLSKRFSASGMRFARFSGACPRWNVHQAFLTPGLIRVQISEVEDGTNYFSFARTIRKDRGSYNAPQTVHALGMGCEVEHAGQLVYADGVDLKNHKKKAVPIGITCRLCERPDCEQRAFRPLNQSWELKTDSRAMSQFMKIEGM
jgi:predicted transcriptional regulator/plasmid maintenance system antidote protein VapI